MSADKLALAIGKFRGGSTATDKQVQQKRDASKRQAILNSKSTPQHIKNKWGEIEKLTKHKNAAKAEFTTMLFKDKGSWQDAYWQASFEEGHEQSEGTHKGWILRSKAEHDHGGGAVGKAAIDDAVAAGIYREKIVFNGKDATGRPIKVSKIQVVEEREDYSHKVKIQEKHRVGCNSSSADFGKAFLEGFSGIDTADAKKKALRNKQQLALCDEDRGARSTVAKKPAASPKFLGKPSAAVKKEAGGAGGKAAVKNEDGTRLTAAKVQAMDEEAESQNQQLNKCLSVAITMLQKQELANKRTSQVLDNATVSESFKRLKGALSEELRALTTEIVQHTDVLKDDNINKQGTAHSDEKISHLDTAHNLIQSSKDMSKSIKGILPKGLATDGASTCAGSRA